MKFRQKIKQLGLEGEKPPAKLRGMISEYEQDAQSLANANHALSQYEEGTDEHNEVLADIAQIETDLEALDEAICIQVDVWNENKDKWAAAGKRLAEGKKNLSGGSGKAAAALAKPVKVVASRAPAPPAPPAPAPPAPAEPVEKKKSGFGAVLLGVIVLGITFGAVNYFNGKE